jgi:hypothetical protein
MHALFPLVLFGSIGLFVVVGVLSMLTRTNNLHDQIGQGGLFVGEDPFGGAPASSPTRGWSGPGGAGRAGGSPSQWGEGSSDSRAERELEIRQMLTARSERLVRRGQEPLDIDAELARLEWAGAGDEPGSHDPALTHEVRQLVLARNERRARQGLDALNVEAEVQRTLAELDP